MLASHPSRPLVSARRDGVALVLVLLFLVIISGVVVAFFASVTTESSAAKSYSSETSTKLLADVAVNLVEAQLADATRGESTPGDVSSLLVWASQPGMIHTFDSSGAPQKLFKLYSADDLVADASGFAPDLPPSDWKSSVNADIYTDLNAPETGSDKLPVYPIVDPLAQNLVDGFSITNPPGYDTNAASSSPALNNPAPMPVKWLYVLQDGTLATAVSVDANSVSIAAATAANPIVGRIAFWADDETAKVNINTASEGTYWDVPRIYSMEDMGQHVGSTMAIANPGFSLCQPAEHEYQRYPGHPATTSLSPVLHNFLPSATPNVTPGNAHLLDDNYYSVTPRVLGGGSEGGTVLPSTSLAFKQDRLYASVDELMFTPRLGSGQARVPNTTTGNGAAPNLITKDVLEKVKFFLTASSNAPETTLFNTPRVAIWPVNSDVNAQTPFDKLMAFCSTIGATGSAAGSPHPYYFTRSTGGARSSTADFTARNQALYKYLQSMTTQTVPGGGGNFATKYGADRDQILTFIYDYIRCTSLQDRSTDGGVAAAHYTPLFEDGEPLGAGEVVPIRIGSTQGFGRFYSISEADMLFYHVKSPDGKSEQIMAFLILEFATPAEGLGSMRCSMSYTVTGLDAMQIQIGPAGWSSLNLPPGGTNYMDHSDLDTFHGRSIGGTEGPTQAFLYDGGQKPPQAGANAHNVYPFISSSGVPLPATPKGQTPPTTFKFTAPKEVQVVIKAADTGQVVQTVHLKFPDGTFRLPDLTDPRPAITTGTFDLVQPQDTVVGLEPSGIIPSNGGLGPSKDSSAGDTRMVEGLQDVPSTRYTAHKNYTTSGAQWAHGLISGVGVSYNGASFGKLVNTDYHQTVSGIMRQPDVPSRVGDANSSFVTRSDGLPGDWDTGIGDQKDGAYINKPDEGDTAFTDGQQGQVRLPYCLGFGQGFAASTGPYFSPNRQIPSPLMFGSIPTGVQRDLPWQTLLFHPRPEDTRHPGKAAPRDEYLADLFWMPVVEPYAISQPFSTAGKINLNYQIQPFTYIRRDTGVEAVMKSTKFMALELGDGPLYKPLDPANFNARAPNRRFPIDIPTTLKEFDKKFAANNVFTSPSQICEIDLVPPGQQSTSMAAFWLQHPLTGDNLREKPYVDLYGRLTTKSNTYTVHFRVQALQKAKATAPNVWVHAQDQVLGEYRGSSIVERYIDVNDPRLAKIDFATSFGPAASAALNLDQYYKLRVVSTKRFSVY